MGGGRIRGERERGKRCVVTIKKQFNFKNPCDTSNVVTLFHFIKWKKEIIERGINQ